MRVQGAAMTTKITAEAAKRLRERAEERLKTDAVPASQSRSAVEAENLILELRLRQIELELENEELRRVIQSDISERKRSDEQLLRLNRSLMAISECNLALFDTRDEAELLNDICRIAVEVGGYRMAWVGYADYETKNVRAVAQAGFEDGYLDTININWAHKEYEDGPVATAIRSGQACLIRNIQEDPRFAFWRGEAGRRSYNSMVALPLKSEDQIFGTLCIYSASFDALDGEEITLLSKFADNLSFGITTLRTRSALLEMEKAAQEAREYAGHLRAEAEKKKSDVRESVLQAITDSVKDAILMMNPEGAVTFWNPAATKIWGYLPDEVLGKHLHNLLIPGRYQERYKSAIPRFVSTGHGDAVGKSLELFALHKDGSEITVDLSLSSVFLDGGWHAVGIVRDITEKKSIMEQLIHSQKVESIGQLAGGLAHDLNNILTVVNGYATLARMRMAKDEIQDAYLDEITRASSRASSLTRSLLVYSRKQEINKQKLNLNDLIATIGSFINRIIRDNISLTISLQDDHLYVDVDDLHIEQVLLNLATNARDAMPDGGTFAIATAAAEIDEEYIVKNGFGAVGRYAVITVSDSGHGMDAETKRQVFDPFFTTKGIGKGTGLGLAMVMGIIKQHGGFIELQSEPGEGSVFKLYLPLLAVAEVIEPVTPRDARMERGSGTILLAEDDPATLILLKELLERAGYKVITAVDGEDAVKNFVAYQDEIQLVISDMVMPNMNGKQVRDKIGELSDSAKFIFISGHAKDVIERVGERDAEAEIIMKPVMPFDLLGRISKILKQ